MTSQMSADTDSAPGAPPLWRNPRLTPQERADGVPAAADEQLLTGLLREQWGFTGTLVPDYFAVRFLQSLHAVAGDAAHAADSALRAGIDVELPTVDAFGTPLTEAVRAGAVDEALIDRALRGVLIQKAELGLLDPYWRALPEEIEAGPVSLDNEEDREITLRLARRSVTVLRNENGILPLMPHRRVALIGPVADFPMAKLGCYSFPAHVSGNTELGLGLENPSLREALSATIPDLLYEPGCAISDDDTSGIAAAAGVAAAADVCVLAVGDRAGLFGRGTSGEDCDAADLNLPGVQAELVRAVLATGTPVVLVLLAGRPYALGEDVAEAAGIVYAFFAGQLGGQAIAEVLTGAVNPCGRLPVSVPRDSGGLPVTYLAPPLGRRSQVSSVDPTPAFPFGHGLSYTTFAWSHAAADSAEVAFEVPADLASFTGLRGTRVVEPGDVELRFGRSSGDPAAIVPPRMTGAEREVGPGRRLTSPVRVERSQAPAPSKPGR